MEEKFHLFPLLVRPGNTYWQTHTDTHITVSDLSQCHASTDSIRGEPLFFSYLLFYFPIRSSSDTHTQTHTDTLVSRLEPNNFSLNVPTARAVQLNTDIQQDHTETDTRTAKERRVSYRCRVSADGPYQECVCMYVVMVCVCVWVCWCR